MSRKLLGIAIVAALSAALAFVWMNRYRFEKVRLLAKNLRFAGSMEPALVRIDRLTGKTEALSIQGWIELKDNGVKQTPEVVDEVPPGYKIAETPAPQSPPVVVLEKAPPDFVPFETPGSPAPSAASSPP